MIALGDVIDGTLCSYDDQDDICIKGKCMVSSYTLRRIAAGHFAVVNIKIHT